MVRDSHSRKQQIEMAIVAARNIVEETGSRGLTVRGVAGDMGYAVGTLYNLFRDLDELIVQVNGRTLHSLYETLRRTPLGGEPESAVAALAKTCIRFAWDRRNLWQMLFEHQAASGPGDAAPYGGQVEQLIAVFDEALAPIFPDRSIEARRHAAAVLWNALCGICISPDDAGSATDKINLAETLVRDYLAGLRLRVAGLGRVGL